MPIQQLYELAPSQATERLQVYKESKAKILAFSNQTKSTTVRDSAKPSHVISPVSKDPGDTLGDSKNPRKIRRVKNQEILAFSNPHHIKANQVYNSIYEKHLGTCGFFSVALFCEWNEIKLSFPQLPTIRSVYAYSWAFQRSDAIETLRYLILRVENQQFWILNFPGSKQEIQAKYKFSMWCIDGYSHLNNLATSFVTWSRQISEFLVFELFYWNTKNSSRIDPSAVQK